MRNPMRPHRFALARLALLAPFAAHAADGAYEINQDCAVVGCFAGDAPGLPVTISQPGRYVLTSNLVANVNANLIDGGASFVDLDLNGFTLEGGQTCAGTPVTTCTAGLGPRAINLLPPTGPMVLHLHDGTIHGFSDISVFASNLAEGTVLERLVVTENGFGVGLSGTVSSTTFRVRDSEISRNNYIGLTGINTSGRLFVENCAFVGNRLDALVMNPIGVAVANRFVDNAGFGISCVTCGLGQNAFSGNHGAGVNPQFNITTVRDMGGNVCLDDGTCP